MPDGEQITPKNNFFLLGQEEAEKALLGAYNSNKLHNSWLISGVKGIGKATLAYRFARFLLDERRRSFSPASSLATDPDSPANRLVSSGSHPDFKVIERDFIETDRKKVLKAIKDGAALDESELKGLKKSAFIRIDDVRGINEFLAKKSSGDGWRAVIIDSIESGQRQRAFENSGRTAGKKHFAADQPQCRTAAADDPFALYQTGIEAAVGQRGGQPASPLPAGT